LLNEKMIDEGQRGKTVKRTTNCNEKA